MCVNRTRKIVLLAAFMAAGLGVEGCDDDGREAVCGNGVIEAGEGCDGQTLPDRTCQDFGFSGGELACSSDCAFDTGGCLDCGGADPCAGATCSGHGTCRLSACEPWCDCEAGYLPGYGLECREAGSCLGLGEECRFPLDCCLGSCIKLGYDATGRCGMLGCVDDAHCAGLAPEETTMCCMEHYAVTACQAVAAEETCGDRGGACGASCAGQFQSACAPGLACVSAGADDPLAACANPCSEDADCLACADPVNPDREFKCVVTSDRQRYCMATPPDCERRQDCPESLFCGVQNNETMTGLEGRCLNEGALGTGEPCDYFANFCARLPHEERCASRYCWFGYCSELCRTDADCPPDMYCTLLIGYGSRTELMPFCVHTAGSETPCSSTVDCPAGEVCSMHELTQEEGFSKVCKTANCDPAQPDCLASGETCQQGSTPCWDGFCYGSSQGDFCAAFCDASSECPDSMFCSAFAFPGGTTTGMCRPLDGSGDACSSDADCAVPGEVCAYFQAYTGMEALCVSPLGEGQIGDPCDNVACANGLCLSDGLTSFCSAPCQVDADCPESFMCHTLPDPFLGNYPVCVLTPGSQDPCTGDQDCTVLGEACFPVLPWGQPLEGRCVEGVSGGAGPGEPCSVLPDCFGRLCLTGLGYCSALCFTNPDCAVHGMECKTFPWGIWGLMPSCVIPDADSPLCSLCAADADCPAADARCIGSQANPGERYCGKPCAGAGDCPAGHSCVDVGGVNNCKPDTDTCVPE